MAKPLHIVLTTINLPAVLRDIARNARQHERLEDVKVWIVGDMKTPATVSGLSTEVNEAGLETVYLDLAAQARLADRIGPFYERLPLNNECRRSLGYLAAAADGCDILLSIDDDNFPMADDLVGGHLCTGEQWTGDLLRTSTGFYNVCELIEIDPPRPVYPRGFPFRLRNGVDGCATVASPAGTRIGVRAGMWLGDPDVDATTWLNGGVRSTCLTGPPTTVLTQDTWSPVNTQNTSVVRDLIPAFLCVPMGWDVPGGRIQRYGDIWGGYFLQALLPGTAFHVAFGEPVVDHRRNPHDYLDDLRGEYWGILLTDWLVDVLRADFAPCAEPMVDRVAELGAFLKRQGMRRVPAWCPAEVRAFIEWTAVNLELWAESCRRALA